MNDHHLAQLNIARMRWPLDDPRMQGFVDRLDPVNALADPSPGFVWRLQTEAGDATPIRAFDDPLVIVNMSVWESIEALFDYVYRSGHAGPLRDRGQWFSRMDGPHVVLWWLPTGHVPGLDEAKARLALVAERGPGPEAFTFRNRFTPAGESLAPAGRVPSPCG